MERITDIKGKLLEGCIWDEKNQDLYFLDIEKFRIYRYRYREKEPLDFLQLDTYVSCIVFNEDGALTAALQDGLYRVDFDGKKWSRFMESGFPASVRYNDGKCDPYGDLWAGSMYADQEMKGAADGGKLFCIHHGQVIREDSPYTIPNGLDWDPERHLFYHTETGKKKISVYRQEEGKRGELGEKIGEIDFSEETGSPDGMCADSGGNLWIAMWGGSQVIGYDPQKREIFQRIPVPDRNVSCCVFGGREGNCLFITTARDEEGKGGEVYVQELNSRGKAGYRYETR